MKRRKTMLTTFDNPFDPFTQFDSWFAYDNDSGYCSCSFLARIGKFSENLTEQENDEEQERAIDEIIKNDIFNVYKKVETFEEEELNPFIEATE